MFFGRLYIVEVLLLNRKVIEEENLRIQVVKSADCGSNESICEQLKNEIRDKLSDLRNIDNT